MKKMILIVAMLMTLGINMFPNAVSKVNFNYTSKYEISVNMRKLGDFLRLDSTQMTEVVEIEKQFSKDLMFAGTVSDNNSRKAVMRNLVDKHVRSMKYVLDDRQFRKYLMVLNLTMKNRELS